ncbi:hypothetical protein OB919_07440 [Halobacteria archaeon AArc-curdl1]|uniref:Uncharacterized protein n=1 Tax=Natronosalvus hydrolyticus TaxID=2979988 RepID=A0AAP2Z855_9EURY|nr:hypothetical protein [Halobacteria archaeon AArc-curdl1]
MLGIIFLLVLAGVALAGAWRFDGRYERRSSLVVFALAMYLLVLEGVPIVRTPISDVFVPMGFLLALFYYALLDATAPERHGFVRVVFAGASLLWMVYLLFVVIG